MSEKTIKSGLLSESYIPYDQIVSGAAFLSDDMRKRYADLLRERGMDMMMAYPGKDVRLMGYYNHTQEPIPPSGDRYLAEAKKAGYKLRDLPPDAVNLLGLGVGLPFVAGHELTHYASREEERRNPEFKDLSEKRVRYLTAFNAPTKESFIDSLKSLYPKLKNKKEITESDIKQSVNAIMAMMEFTNIPPVLINPDSYIQTRYKQNPFKRMYRGIFGIEQPEEKLRDM